MKKEGGWYTFPHYDSTLENTRSLQVAWNNAGTTQMYGFKCYFEKKIRLKDTHREKAPEN